MNELDIGEWVKELEADGVQFRVEEDALLYRAPTEVLTSERADLIRTHEKSIRELVRAQVAAGPAPQVDDAEDVWQPLAPQVAFFGGREVLRMGDIRRWPCGGDLRLCQIALDELIKRHSILRTRFVKDPSGRFWAVTEQQRQVPIGFLDVSELAEPDQDARIRDLASQLYEEPFNHETGPLVRLSLVKKSDDEYVSVLVVCHSVSDAWALRVFFSDVAALYEAARTGAPPALKPLKLQYRDFARRRIEYLASEQAYEHVLYWRRAILAHLTDPILLAADRRTPVPSRSAHRAPIIGRVGAETLQALTSLAQASGATMFPCVAAAVAVVFAHWSGGRDLFSWVAVTTRGSVELQKLCGHFIDCAPFLVRIRDEATFRELLEDARRTFVESMRHFDVTPALLGPTMRGIRQRVSFSSTILNYVVGSSMSPPSGSTLLDGLGRLNMGGISTRYDEHVPIPIGFEFVELEDELCWKVPFKDSVFEDSTIEAMSLRIERLLDVVARDPDVRFRDLPGTVLTEPLAAA